MASGNLLYSSGSLAQCSDDLDGWEGGRRVRGWLKSKRIYEYI